MSMAKNQEEEASPLLPISPCPPVEAETEANLTSSVKAEKEANRTTTVEAEKEPEVKKTSQGGKESGEENEWTAEGLPIGHVSVVGQSVRNEWSSGLLSCLGRNDEFHSSDLEVCLLGSMVPCVLYGSNEERLAQEPIESFSTNCKLYTALYVVGNFLFGWNCIAPWYSHTTRTAIRRKYNLEGTFESFARSCSCLSSSANNSETLERFEIACDLATHYLCHQCALCQEGRELRRRVPHPGFFAPRPAFSMVPPAEQVMSHPDKN